MEGRGDDVGGCRFGDNWDGSSARAVDFRYFCVGLELGTQFL
jgi:hypothetical protein